MSEDQEWRAVPDKRPRLVKLVRDEVGQFLGGDGIVAYRPVTEQQHIEGLRAKLVEEAVEYLLRPSVDELADVLEVVRGLADRDLNLDTGGLGALGVVHQRMEEKHKERGGFSQGVGMFVETTAPLTHEGEHAAERPKCTCPGSVDPRCPLHGTVLHRKATPNTCAECGSDGPLHRTECSQEGFIAQCNDGVELRGDGGTPQPCRIGPSGIEDQRPAQLRSVEVEICNWCGGLVGWEKIRAGCCPGGVVCHRVNGTRMVLVQKVPDKGSGYEFGPSLIQDAAGEAYHATRALPDGPLSHWTDTALDALGEALESPRSGQNIPGPAFDPRIGRCLIAVAHAKGASVDGFLNPEEFRAAYDGVVQALEEEPDDPGPEEDEGPGRLVYAFSDKWQMQEHVNEMCTCREHPHDPGCAIFSRVPAATRPAR